MRTQLSDDRRVALIRSLNRYFEDNFDEPLSEFRAAGLLDFFIAELGPAVYNQGVHDAHDFMQTKLMDLEGEVYETEPPV